MFKFGDKKRDEAIRGYLRASDRQFAETVLQIKKFGSVHLK